MEEEDSRLFPLPIVHRALNIFTSIFIGIPCAQEPKRRPGGGPRLSEISCTYDPPIYDITSGWRVAALFSREAQRWTPDVIWFSRCFYPQANGIMYLECREC